MLLLVLALLSGLTFALYGYNTLFGQLPKIEFDRYGMPGLRSFVGAMQVLGATGVLLGLIYRPIGALAASGLTLMMVLGLVTRVRIGDVPRLMIPAAALAVLNIALVGAFLMG